MIKSLALIFLLNSYQGALYAPPPIPVAPIVQPKAKPKPLPQSRLIKLLNEDIWEVKEYLNQCYQRNNAKICAGADPNIKEIGIPPITIMFKLDF